MTYEATGHIDNRTDDGEIAVWVVSDDDMHQVIFAQHDTGVFVPDRIYPETYPEVSVEFVVNGGLARASTYVEEEFGVEVPAVIN